MALSVLLSLCAMSWPAWATADQEDAVLHIAYPYVVVEQDVKEVLQELRRNLGLGAVISNKVSGTVRGSARHDDTAESFLRRLALEHDLVWYLDRDTLYVFAQEESVTQLLAARHLDAQRRNAIAKQWSAKGSGVHVSVDESSRSLLVTGPPEFRARIAQIVAVPPAPPAATGNGPGVTVFRSTSGRERVAVPR